MWLAALSAEFIGSSKEQIRQDPETFWPEEEGEIISSNWASYPGTREIYFEGDESEAYAGTEGLPHIEVLLTERGTEFRGPDEVSEELRNQIMDKCKPWIEEARAGLTAIADELDRGRGIAEIRSMDSDIALSIDLEAKEPVNPVKDSMMVLMSVSFREVVFRHMLGLVFRGTFHKWEIFEGDGGSGFTTDYYDENGHRYMSFSTYGQGSEIEVY
jgi:hypothetical protein